MNLTRGSTILLHLTSLSGAWEIGGLGPTAYQFVDFLKALGQSWCQILPLGPTGDGNSSYICYCVLAGNPMPISSEKLVEDEFASAADAKRTPSFPAQYVNYCRAIQYNKRSVFEKSFKPNPLSNIHVDKSSFCSRQACFLNRRLFPLFVLVLERDPWEIRVGSMEHPLVENAGRPRDSDNRVRTGQVFLCVLTANAGRAFQ